MLFARGFVRLRRRGRPDHASAGRAALFVLAVTVGILALVSPLDAAAGTSFSAHMLQHVLIGDLAPALALLALRGPLLFFVVPAAVARPFARSAQLRSSLAFVSAPRASLALWASVVAAWHVPVAYDYALAHPAAHDLEHLTFVVAGALAWFQIVDPARRRALLPAHRLTCVLGMLALTLALGGLLVLAPPLYPAYDRSGALLFGLAPSADQHLAGLLMVAGQLAVLALCAGLRLPPTEPAWLSRTRTQKLARMARFDVRSRSLGRSLLGTIPHNHAE